MTTMTLNASEPPTGLRTSRHNRRTRAAQVPDTLGRFHKLFALLDGSSTSSDILNTAIEAAFAQDAVIVTYASDKHVVDQVLAYSDLAARFVQWSQGGVAVTLEHVKPLAPSILEFTLHVKKSNDDTEQQQTSSQEETGNDATKTDAAVSSSSSEEKLICTATLREGKIISCVEKKLPNPSSSNNKKERQHSLVDIEVPNNDNNTNETDPNQESFHSGSSSHSDSIMMHKGTGLECVEQRGGAIFMNKKDKAANDMLDHVKDAIVITVVTQQDGTHNDLELLTLRPPSKFGLTKRSKRSKEFMPPGTVACHLLQDAQHCAIVLCRTATTTEQLGTYFIDGHLPLDPKEKPISRYNKVDFFPRYQFDHLTQKVQIWNGSSYEPYMDANHGNQANNKKKKQWSPDMVGLSSTQNKNNNSTPPSSTPACVAHVSKKGGTNQLRAKIKIPAGDDPSLMICLTALSDHHKRGNQTFTKLCLTRNSSEEGTGTDEATTAATTTEAPTSAESPPANDALPPRPEASTKPSKKKKSKGDTVDGAKSPSSPKQKTTKST